MIGRSGTAAAALLYALGGCSSDAPKPAPEPSAPPPPVYDLEQPTGGLQTPLERDGEFRRGISLGAVVGRKNDDARKAAYTAFLDEIAATGATDLQLMVRWAQHDVTSSEITPHPTETIDDSLLAWLMEAAKSRSLRLFVVPSLRVESIEPGTSPGDLAPADPERWWWSYRRFVLHYARMAQSHGVTSFAAGSELRSLEGDAEHWRALIADIRKFFEGEVTYSAAWDRFEAVAFWDALDVVGVTAFASLAPSTGASDDALMKGAQGFATRLRKWALAGGHRYLFTEAGYPAHSGAATKPSEFNGKAKADPLLQLRCYRALYKAFQDDARLSGLYAWRWAGQGGASDAGYTPRGKPALAVLSHWFQGSRRAASAVAP